MPCNKTRSKATSISRQSGRITRTVKYQIPEEAAASPHHEYISRHVGLEEYGPDTRVKICLFFFIIFVKNFIHKIFRV